MFPSTLSTLFILVLGHCFSVSAHSAPPRPLKRIAHPSTQSLQILPRLPASHTPNAPFKRNPPHPLSTELRHSDSFRLILSAFDETFYLHLRPNDHLIHPAARINYYDTDANGESRLAYTEPLVRESVKVYWGEVIVPHKSDDRLLEDAAGVIPRPSFQDERGWARIMIHHQGDADHGIAPVFEGAFSIEGNIHHIMTKDNYLRNKHTLDPDIMIDNQDSQLVVWRDSDALDHVGGLTSPMANAQSCGHDGLSYNTDPVENPFLQPYEEPGTSWLSPFLPPLFANQSFKRDDVAGSNGMSVNFINTIGKTDGCPKSPKVLYMGVASDCKYTSRYGGSQNATQQILSNWNVASSLYKSTFNVSLGIVELQIQNESCPSTADPNIAWNVDCTSVTLNQRLSLFSAWRGAKGNDTAGLWHLMSGCPTGTEVGIAWLATLCQQSSSGTNPSVVSGTAVSTAGRTEWQVVAHEIGHNFGAIHDCASGCNLTSSCCPLNTGTCDANSQFLMSPVAAAGEMNFSPCSVGNICSVMQANSVGSHTDTSCLVDPDQARQTISLKMCGNGIVEAGEDCDPGQGSNSTCCDTTTCKFKNGAVCDPDSSPCCTDQCSFAPASQVCRPSKDSSCDTAETCTGNSSSCPADVMAPNGRSCGGNDLACASGVCTSIAKQCQTVGASMNLQQACPSPGDTSCQISCQDPTQNRQCIVLQSLLIDGSPCGYGGMCSGGQCKSGSFLDTAKAWFRSNLQISIPVTIIVSIVILLLIWALFTTIRRCVRNRRAGYPVMPLTPRFMTQRNTATRIHSGAATPEQNVPSMNRRGSNWVDETRYNGPR